MSIEFERLKAEWLEDTKFVSSVSDMTRHPAYQAIIHMGQRVLPYIFRDLEAAPKHWGPALFAITGASPVPKEDAGRLRKAAAAWIRWAREHDYKW